MIAALNSDDKDGISDAIGNLDVHVNKMLETRADIGARTNRMNLVISRIAENNIGVYMIPKHVFCYDTCHNSVIFVRFRKVWDGLQFYKFRKTLRSSKAPTLDAKYQKIK